MKNPKLTDVAWLGPRDEMDRASHYFGRCTECDEIICVAKAVTDGPSTQRETSEMLHEAFRAHAKHPLNLDTPRTKLRTTYSDSDLLRTALSVALDGGPSSV